MGIAWEAYMNHFTHNDFLENEITVLLAGCGGSGSFMMAELSHLHDLLTRLGHKGLKVIAYDPTPVRDSNLGRQKFRAADIGKNKAECLIHYQRQWNGFTHWEAHSEALTSRIIERKYMSYGVTPTILITAVDLPSVRSDFGKIKDRSAGRAFYWLDLGNDSDSGQVVLGGLAGSNELPNAYDLFGSQYDNMKDSDSKSCSTAEALAKQDFGVNGAAAHHGVTLLWRLLRHGGLEHHGVFFNVAKGEAIPMQIDPKLWATYGYVANK